MKKHDALFSGIIILSSGLFGSVIADSILDEMESKIAAARPAEAMAQTAATPDDPARTATVQKKFEAMGLKPHEGKYWKELK